VVHGDINWVRLSTDALLRCANVATQVNVFVDNNASAKIADFGLAVISEGTTAGRMKTSASGAKGTPAWMSPERINMDHHHPTPAMDVYSFGVLCYAVRLLPQVCCLLLKSGIGVDKSKTVPDG
jgi:serine/threonine protein kinase